MSKRKSIDWVWIEAAYRGGLNPQDIADAHYQRTGVRITRAAVTMRARRKGWPTVAERDARRKHAEDRTHRAVLIGAMPDTGRTITRTDTDNAMDNDGRTMSGQTMSGGRTIADADNAIARTDVNRTDTGVERRIAEIDNEVRESERRAVIDRQLAVLDDLDRQASAVLERAQQLLDHADRPGDVRDLAQAVDKMAHLRLRQIELIRRWLGLDDADNNNHGHVTQIAIVVDGERVSERVIQG